MNEGNKYFPLHLHLRQRSEREITLTLSDIEALLAVPLPASARSRRAWWSNRSKGGHQAAAWMEAGYHVVDFDIEEQSVTFRKPQMIYEVQRDDDTVLWNGDLIRALRQHMGLSQTELAKTMGVRQQTISEWEQGMYRPRRAMSKYLMMIAERAGFTYGEDA